MRTSMVVAATCVAALTPTLADASPQPVTGAKVAGGNTAVGACGALTGLTLSWTSQANVVTKVVVGSIPSACVGGQLSLTLLAANNSSLGAAGPVTLTGTAVTLTAITGTRTATSTTGARVVVVGP